MAEDATDNEHATRYQIRTASFENLEASDEDVEAEYAKMASQYNMDVENVKKYMDDAVVREQVVRTKAIDLAVASAVAVKPEDIKTEEPKAEEPAAEEPKPEKPKRTRKKKAEPKPEEGSAAEDAQ